MAFTWDDNLALGNSAIDDQHKEIFARFDKLSLACQKQRGGEELKELLDFLDEYVAHHFADEEALMERIAYPGLALQRDQHAEFRQNISELHARSADETEKHKLSLDVDRMLIQWFILHIRSLDVKLVEFVKNQQQ